ncbi:hypothetical protein WA556_000786 [Blastocystis sp. ATCC 50177/Nand II]
MWEVLLLTTIGEQFDVGSEICGVSVSIKRNACTFMVWNKTATYEMAINKIEMKLRLIWNAPMNLRFTYKLNRAAVEKVAKPLQPFHNKEEVENELLRKRSTNRFADLSDDDKDSDASNSV